jgi:hypothetical protein
LLDKLFSRVGWQFRWVDFTHMISFPQQQSTREETMPRHVPVILIPLLLLAALPAGATTPRLHALGSAGDYLEDDANAARWYGSLADYDNAVTVDFGHVNIYKGYHDAEEHTLSGPSLHLRHDLGQKWGQVAAWWFAREDDAPFTTLYRDYREKSFALQYGRRLGSVQLALHFHNTPRQETVSSSGAAHTIGTERALWGLGARFDISAGAYLDLAADRRTNRETITFADPPYADLGQDLTEDHAHNLRARLFLQLGERTALVPVAEYLSENRPVHKSSEWYIRDIDGDLLRLSCGLEFFPDTDRLLLAAAEWTHGSAHYAADFPYQDREWTENWNSYALQLGWENRYLPWLSWRGAVGYRLTRGDGYPPAWEDLLGDGYDYDLLWYTLGGGVHLGGWDLDAALSSEEPRPVSGDYQWTRVRYDHTWLSVSLRYSY